MQPSFLKHLPHSKCLYLFKSLQLNSANTKPHCVSHSPLSLSARSLFGSFSGYKKATPSDSVQPDNALLLRYRMPCKEIQPWQRLTDHQTWERALQSSWLLEAAALHVSDTDTGGADWGTSRFCVVVVVFYCRRHPSYTFPWFSSVYNLSNLASKPAELTSSALLIGICNAHGTFFFFFSLSSPYNAGLLGLSRCHVTQGHWRK